MLSIGASIGIAFYSENIKDVSELINEADAAMYQAKSAGKNTNYFAEKPKIADITKLDRRK